MAKDRDADGMHIYALENDNEALSLRVADLELSLRGLTEFLKKCDLPYRVVSPILVELEEKLEREVSSYQV